MAEKKKEKYEIRKSDLEAHPEIDVQHCRGVEILEGLKQNHKKGDISSAQENLYEYFLVIAKITASLKQLHRDAGLLPEESGPELSGDNKTVCFECSECGYISNYANEFIFEEDSPFKAHCQGLHKNPLIDKSGDLSDFEIANVLDDLFRDIRERLLKGLDK